MEDSEREFSEIAGDSLKRWTEFGTRGERGFKLKNELLLRGMYVS